MGNLFFIADKFLADFPVTFNGYMRENKCPKILFKSSTSKGHGINQIRTKDRNIMTDTRPLPYVFTLKYN
jgi:hypothetical protein